jgi:chromosome segregation ATPase
VLLQEKGDLTAALIKETAALQEAEREIEAGDKREEVQAKEMSTSVQSGSDLATKLGTTEDLLASTQTELTAVQASLGALQPEAAQLQTDLTSSQAACKVAEAAAEDNRVQLKAAHGNIANLEEQFQQVETASFSALAILEMTRDNLEKKVRLLAAAEAELGVEKPARERLDVQCAVLSFLDRMLTSRGC